MTTEYEGNPAATDQPPDPEAAAASVREARRRLAASQGIVKAILGLVFLVAFAIVQLATECHTRAEVDTVILLVIALVAMEVLLPPIVSRLRRRRGLIAMGRLEAETERTLARTGSLVALALLAIGGVLAAAVAIIVLYQAGISPEWLAGFDTAVILGLTAMVVLLLALRYRSLGLHEDLLMAAGVATAGAMLALAREAVRVETVAMIVAAVTLAAGISLHLRWRQWGRSRAGQGGGPVGEEVRP